MLSKVAEDKLDSSVLRLGALLAEVSAHANLPNASMTTGYLTTVNKTVTTIREAIPDRVETLFVKSAATGNTTPLASLASAVRAWPTTSSGRLKALSGEVETLEQMIGTLAASLKSNFTELSELAEQYRSDTTEDLQAHKVALAKEAESISSLVAEATTTFQEEHSSVLASLADAEETISQQTTRLDTAIASQQETFAKKQEERTNEWSELVANNDTEMREHVTILEGYEEQSRKVLAAVGVNSTATDYGAYANEQSIVANRWRIGAVIAFSAAALAFLTAATLSFFGIGANDEWWQVVAQKIGAPAGAAAVGYFLARESGQHRKEERRARQVQLTLTALEPFIVHLPPEQQERIRVDTALGIFAQRTNESPAAPEKAAAPTKNPPE